MIAWAGRMGLCAIGVMVVVGTVTWVSAPLFVVANLITGVGFGLGFMSSTHRVTQAAPLDRRGEVLAAYFALGYVAIF